MMQADNARSAFAMDQGPMDHHRFKDELSALQISIHTAARLFGVDDDTARHWALGVEPVPRPVSLALGLMAKGNMTPEEILSLVKDGAILTATDDDQD